MKRFLIVLFTFFFCFCLLLFFYFHYSKLQTENIVFAHKSAESQGDRVLVLRVEQQAEENSFELFSLPAKSKTKLLGSYGVYELRAIYPLLQLDKKDDAFINANFASALEILVNRSIALEEIPDLEDLSSFRKLLLATCFDHKAALSLKERLLLLKLFFRISEFHFHFSKLDDLAALQIDENAASCSVAVINSTQKNGLGKDIGVLLEKNGFRVVKIGDTSQLREVSQVVLTKDESDCASFARALYTILPKRAKVAFDEALFTQHRADIVIFLGTDLTN